jgi:hypothetical protein
MIKVTLEDTLEIPVDELALQVLEDMVHTRDWNTYNYRLHYKSDEAYRQHGNAVQAVAEAIQWLWSHRMIASKPGDSTAQAMFITRRGHEALGQGIETVRSINGIEGNLHPLIAAKARRQFLLGEYENAIFVSMMAVEVRVRKLGSFGDDLFGTGLMTKAFKAGGPLSLSQ